MTDLNQLSNDKDPVILEKRKKKIRSIRYKVYIFLLVVFLIFIWPSFISDIEEVRGAGAMKGVFGPAKITEFFTQRGTDGLMSELESIKRQIEEIEKQIVKTQVDIKIVEHLDKREKQNTLVLCLNNGLCDDIPQTLLENIDLLRGYILVDNLEGEKMSFNQKFVLSSINDYLLKTPGGSTIGSLSMITFAEPILVSAEHSLMKLPVRIDVLVDNKQMFFELLRNFEKRVSFTYPLLYKIDSINYDIVEYENPQSLALSLSIYYYTEG